VDYPEIVCVRNDTNKGTSQRNKGLQISHGKYVAFVDSDIELLENHTFDMLVEFLKKNKDVGLVAPQLVLDNGEIQLSCKNFLSFYTPIMRRFDFLPFIKKTRLYRDQLLADWDHRETRYVDYTVSAFWVFRKEIYNNIGGLDEKIFYAPEDVDYCLRIRKSGYKVAYFPSVKVKHHYQRITRKIFSKITYEHIKGLLYYFKKHKYLLKPKI
ncbi:MAG: glycosyltransferase, partial [Ignavibacteria bacterium]|nr:glycosyltransferase [Ignavibacteria bacterium]